MNIEIINSEPVIKSFHDLACGKTLFAQISNRDANFRQEQTKPLDGFVFPDEFPSCCENHKQLLKIAVDKFAKFPNCCKYHAKLNGAHWFRKSDYSYFPDKLLKTLTYTFHCIDVSIEKPDWYDAITDYIEYTAMSYGQFPECYGPPLGLELYLENLARNVEATKAIPKEKKGAITKFAREYGKPKAVSNETDLNILLSSYQKWLKLFPFELQSYFGDLKSYFEKNLPLLDGKPQVNRYTGLAKASLVSKDRLFETLLRITDNILTEINGPALLKEGVITDANRAQLELIIQERKQKLKKGYTNSSPDESHRFRKMIKEWLNDEQGFWKKIEPVLNMQQNKCLEQASKEKEAGFEELDVEALVKFMEKQDAIREEQLTKGFVELEKYIVKNVYENVRADYERLKQLKRNLLNWKAQLTTVFIEPENQVHDDLEYFKGMKTNAERMVGKIVSALEILGERIEHKQTSQPIKNETGKKSYSPIKPILKPESLDIVFDILKGFFSQEQKPVLKKILQTGDNAGELLIFLDNGSRLADAFKQLKKADVISGCEQKELERWISENFKFRFRGEIRDFKLKYLNDIISTNKDLCRKPLLNVSRQKGTGKVLITKA